MSLRKVFLFLVLLCLSTRSLGRDVFVDSSTGQDETECGEQTSPCASIGYVMTSVADSGDTVRVRGYFDLSRPVGIMKDVTIQSDDDDIPSSLDCNSGLFSALSVAPNLHVKISNLQVLNCAPVNTGAIQVFDSEIILERVLVKGNSRSRGQGAGLSLLGGKATILGSIIEDNLSQFGGAGISCLDCELSLESTQIIKNQSPQGRGSAIYLSGEKSRLLAKNVIIAGNTGDFGSGLYVVGEIDSVECVNVDFVQNTANSTSCAQVVIEGKKEGPSSSSSESSEVELETEVEEPMIYSSYMKDENNIWFIGCNFVSSPSSSSSICFANSNVQIVESTFEDIGIECFNAEFSIHDSTFKTQPTTTCTNCVGWIDEDAVCTESLFE